MAFLRGNARCSIPSPSPPPSPSSPPQQPCQPLSFSHCPEDQIIVRDIFRHLAAEFLMRVSPATSYWEGLTGQNLCLFFVLVVICLMITNLLFFLPPDVPTLSSTILCKIPALENSQVKSSCSVSFQKRLPNTNMSDCQTNKIRDLSETPKLAQNLWSRRKFFHDSDPPLHN